MSGWQVLRLPAALALIALAACREAPAPFESDDNPPSDAPPPTRLTWNTGSDIAPTWSADGDSVYYSAFNYPGVPGSDGVLLTVADNGGAARVLLPRLQSEATFPRWLTAPAISTSGDRIAVIEPYRMTEPPVCTTICPSTPEEEIAPFVWPGLDSARVHVLSLATGEILASVTIRFPGRSFDSTRRIPGVAGTTILDYHPFHARWMSDRTPVFRPSWSPDGTRIVFSDGLRLLVWTIGQQGVQEVPGTEDGALPAWSPDGQTIAYSRLPRGTRTVEVCNCTNRGFLIDLQERITYSAALENGVLTTVRPDGSSKRELGEGDAPAWTSNGRLVFRRQNQIWTSNADGGSPAAIAGTESGNMPAVSPDGTALVFARRAGGSNFDIWVASLAGTQ